MTTLTLVTGNKNKLAEWQRLVPANVNLETTDMSLDEIQSLSLLDIVEDKAKRAFAKLHKPVVVDDISAGLEEIKGLPGPFIKYFEKKMGDGSLYKLAKQTNSKATVLCLIAYFDGSKMLVARAEVHGTVVSPRGSNGWGFDRVFIPDRQSKTYAQMSPADKDRISSRAKAIASLLEQL